LFGANGIPWLFDLELTTETPGIADVTILMPNDLTALVAQQLATMGLGGVLDASGLHFPVKGSLRIPNVALPPDANFGCAVRVGATGPGTGVWNIAQIAQETVVGRLTFSLPALAE